ncbi:polyferredoxin-like protein [Desulfurivibrio alkaliphilus]|uniref:Polyferredoxin-like protein n=1 Tax=Desulfurivibrio alkaliphilus (strain DSM 19089 / UNIQEM U267 / AHT2) TaxID=589865 RepID=D6Z1X7_DESAT|nr:polyferredoxin-like protein [Desulfurivibrio alkaliphilus]ADH85552.1 polyferredoxin-like protein [Desulfurivibrio alkaliphilus AHT 2]
MVVVRQTALLLMFWLLPGLLSAVVADELPPLRLTLAPPVDSAAAAGEECAEGHVGHGGGRGNGGPRLESEHRPVSQRTYHLNQYRRGAAIRAYVRRPDGAVFEPELILGASPRLTFATPPGDGPTHGAHNVYLVEEGVEDGVLAVRVAKWITMHHSCRWGHDGKFNPDLINPQQLDTVPFEIVVDDLWSRNFHAAVRSGDNLRITVLSYGAPVAGAEVTLTTEQGWRKTVTSDEQGMARIQLIRDYYPSLWQEFRRSHRGPFEVSARWRTEKTGEFRGEPYGAVSYQITHPWVYSPPEREYSSYASGLLLAATMMIAGGGGVYLYRERRRRPYRGVVFDE